MKLFNFLSILMVCTLMVFTVEAQKGKDKSKRKSPPAQVSKEVKGTTVTIDYSRPSKRERVIFGGLVPYEKVWRTGANESTWFEVSNDVEVEGEKLAAGKYGLFTIPDKEEWTIIFNKKWKGWGAYEYDEKEDVLRVKVKPSKTELTEMFTMDIEENGKVWLAWDETKVAFTIK